jgi:serine/threonine protein kinase
MDMERVGSATNLGLEGFIKKSSIDARTVEGLQLLARKVQPPRGPIDRDYLAPPQFMTLLEALASPVLREPSSDGDAPTVRIETTDQSKDTVLLTSDPTKQIDAGDTKPEDLSWLQAAGQPPDLAGTMLGKVRLDKKIGSGSGGAVYRGTHTNLDLPVAVKVLHAELAALDSEYAMAFLLEARTAARVNHANVVRVLDCDRDEAGSGAYYIVMEYVVGNSLEEEIRLHGFIHEERLTGIAIGVSHALVAAHDAEIVHRDIKPANILLDRNDVVKLADLGLAKRGRPMEGLAARRHLESHSARRRKEIERTGLDTKEIAVQGTPYYMAPEQVTDPMHIDARADVYSFGATLYHSATGALPFTGNSIPEILLHQVETPPTPPRVHNPALSKGLEKTILRMMAKDRDARPSGPREVLSILRHHLQGLQAERRWRRERWILRLARKLFGR